LDLVAYFLTTIGAFLFVLTLCTFVHEYGHYAVARAFGVKVDTFCVLGWGAPFWSVLDKHGTRWGVAPFPLGAYVKFAMIDGVATWAAAAARTPEQRSVDYKAGYITAQPVGARALISLAGPLANFAFSTLVFASVFLVTGLDVTDNKHLTPRIDQIEVGSPAALAGIRPGDVVVAIDGRMIDTFGELQARVVASPGKPLHMSVERSGSVFDLVATPTAHRTIDDGGARIVVGRLGIARTTLPEERKIKRLNPVTALGAGAERVWEILSSTVTYLFNLVTGRASAEHLVGVLGIMDTSGKVLQSSLSAAPPNTSLAVLAGGALLNLLMLAGWLSVALGFSNLLPIPITDGGNLMLYAIEAARGRPISEKTQMLGVHAGLAIIAGLFLVGAWNDLQRLNVLEFLSGILS